MNLIPETWPQQAGPPGAVNQPPHQQSHRSDIRKAYLNGSINPINPRHIHPCEWGLKPVSIITGLWYCSYSIFSPLWLPLLSLRLRKECKNRFSFKRERKTDIFSQGVELEDMWNSTEGCVLTAVMAIMKSNLVQIVANQWGIQRCHWFLIFDWGLCSCLIALILH